MQLSAVKTFHITQDSLPCYLQSIISRKAVGNLLKFAHKLKIFRVSSLYSYTFLNLIILLVIHS
jgi:hypothetical protein